MTLDLTGSYFDHDSFGHSQQNAADVMATDKGAVLYVFKPYHNQFQDVGLRPFQYSFDENFLFETQEITNLAKRAQASAPDMVRSLMTSVNLNDKMMPSLVPTMQLRTSHLSDRWRFILVMTEKTNGLMLGNTMASNAGSSKIRRIYTGFFEDEPFNVATFSSHRRSLNPGAIMVITHKTIVGTALESTRFGPRVSVNTQSSEEIVNPALSTALISRDGGDQKKLYLMTPSNCINSIAEGEDGFSFSVPGAHSDLTLGSGSNFVPDVLEQPAHNVAQVVKGMIRVQDDISHRSRMTTHKVDNYFDDEFTQGSNIRQKMFHHLSLPRSRMTSPFDLDVDARISVVDLDNIVNHDLDVIDFDLERPMYYETADQMEQSVVNQYQFLIASVISPIMASAGLNAMQFEYQIARIAGNVQEKFIPYSAEPNWPVPNSDLLSMAKAVEVELVDGIFATIFHSKGDFHVAVSANATGMTTVRLNLIGQGYRNHVDFEIPSCMGGLVSPLVGDEASNAGNSAAIETLFSEAMGFGQNAGRNFTDDDHSFANYAENGNWGNTAQLDTRVGSDNEREMSLD